VKPDDEFTFVFEEDEDYAGIGLTSLGYLE
jgi:hypothetical protein